VLLIRLPLQPRFFPDRAGFTWPITVHKCFPQLDQAANPWDLAAPAILDVERNPARHRQGVSPHFVGVFPARHSRFYAPCGWARRQPACRTPLRCFYAANPAAPPTWRSGGLRLNGGFLTGELWRNFAWCAVVFARRRVSTRGTVVARLAERLACSTNEQLGKSFAQRHPWSPLAKGGPLVGEIDPRPMLAGERLFSLLARRLGWASCHEPPEAWSRRLATTPTSASDLAPS